MAFVLKLNRLSHALPYGNYLLLFCYLLLGRSGGRAGGLLGNTSNACDCVWDEGRDGRLEVLVEVFDRVVAFRCFLLVSRCFCVYPCSHLVRFQTTLPTGCSRSLGAHGIGAYWLCGLSFFAYTTNKNCCCKPKANYLLRSYGLGNHWKSSS